MRFPGLVWHWLRSEWGRGLPDAGAFSVAPEAPPALETLRVVQRGEHSLRLRWHPVPGAQGFRLRWRPEGENCPRLGGAGSGTRGGGAGGGADELGEVREWAGSVVCWISDSARNQSVRWVGSIKVGRAGSVK